MMPLGLRPGKARGTMNCESGDLPVQGAPLVPSREREVDVEEFLRSFPSVYHGLGFFSYLRI